MASPLLDEIAAHGNRGLPTDYIRGRNNIVCADGFRLSVIAGWGAYCSPRPGGFSFLDDPVAAEDYPGPYDEVEVGFPSERPEPWADRWLEFCDSPEDPTGTVYGNVPVQFVRDLIELHGGEVTP